MGVFGTFVLIAIIIGVAYLYKHQEKVIYNNKLKEINDNKIRYAKVSNRNLLKELGDEKFAMWFGKDQLNLIKNDRDTRSVASMLEWERKANGGSCNVR
jgi:hypothetical protein